MEGVWPADVEAVDLAGASGAALSCATLVWLHAGALRVTVIGKATFDLVHDQPLRLRAPDDIVTRDRHLDDNPLRSVHQASDVVPFRPRADVTLVGHAHAPPGAPTSAMMVRLALYRDARILERTLHVYGDRDAAGNVRTFQRVPLTPECALETSDNPIGSKSPNVVDSRGPMLAGSFAPVSRYWPPRARLLRGTKPPAGDAFVEIPNDFDWGYYQAAPIEQQIPYLRGDEWIVLDGLHPSVPRLKTQLPKIRMHAVVHALSGAQLGAGRALALSADSLAIDVDRMTCSIGFRGAFPAQSEQSLPGLKILVGLELGGVEVRWPPLESVALPRAVVPLRTAPRADLGTTKTMHGQTPPAAAVPFVAGTPSAPRPHVPSFAAADDDTEQTGSTSVYSPEVAAQLRARPDIPFTSQASSPGLSSEEAMEGTFSLSEEESRLLAEPPRAPTFGAAPLPKELAPHPAPVISFDAPHSAQQPRIIESPAARSVMAPVARPPVEDFDGTVDLSEAELQKLVQQRAAPFVEPRPGERKPQFAVPSMRSDDDDETGTTNVLSREELMRATELAPALPFGGRGPTPPIISSPATPVASPPPMMRERARTLPSTPSSSVPRAKAVEPPVVISPPTLASAPFAAHPVAMPLPPTPAPPAPPPPLPPPPGPPEPSPSSKGGLVSSASLGAIERELVGAPPSIDPGAPTAAAPKLLVAEPLPPAAAKSPSPDESPARARVRAKLAEGGAFDDDDLAGVDLSGLDFSGRSLVRCKLRRAKLTGAILTGAQLAGAQLEDADLTDAKADGADLSRADLSRAVLVKTSLVEARLGDARLVSTTGKGAVLRRATGHSLDFARGDWSDAVFDEGDFTGADFTASTLARASFKKANLDGAKLSRARAEGASFDQANLGNADLRHTVLAQASLTDAILRGTRADHADLQGAKLLRADLSSASLRGANLAKAILANAKLDATDLRSADLEGANVHGASRQTAKMTGAKTDALVETPYEEA